MGEVFLCRQEIGGVRRFVVQKRMLPEVAEHDDLVALFLDEARITAQLRHDGIVQVYDFGRDHDGYFLTMEYVAGQNLSRVVTRIAKEQRAIPRPVAAYVVLEIARALEHAHTATDVDGNPLGIVHRDISPSNVMIAYDGSVKLMDFGIAKAAGRSSRTRTGVVRGKYAYMSPEQISGAPVDVRSDVFSTGVMLWELTLKRRLFHRDTDLETISAVLADPIPDPTAIAADYPPELERVVMAALTRDRAKRMADAASLIAGLKAYLVNAPADRDAVAALVGELFANELQAERSSSEQPTRRETPVTAPTLQQVPPGPSMDASIEPSIQTSKPRRKTGLLVAAMTVTAGITTGILWLARSKTDAVAAVDATVSAPHEPAAAVPVVPDAASPVEVADVAPVGSTPQSDAGVDAPVGHDRRRATVVAHHELPDAGVTARVDATTDIAATGQVMFKPEDTYYRHGLARCQQAPPPCCSLEVTPTTCTLPAGAQRMTLVAPDGQTVVVAMTVVAGRRVVCTASTGECKPP